MDKKYMENLSPEQRKILNDIIKLEKPELMPILDVLESINANLKAIAEKETPVEERPEVQKMSLEGVETVTIKGKDGIDGKDGEDSVIPGPQGERGPEGKAGRDGKDGVNGVDGLDGKDGLNGENGKDGSPDTSEQIIEKINGDESEKKIKREKVEGLDEELKAIRELPRGGGGTSAMGVRQAFKYIFHTEQPTGLINGSNTTYTVKNTIFAVVAFSLNGEVIAQLPNYTIAGRTITFSTALSADYSGSDFECKYIG